MKKCSEKKILIVDDETEIRSLIKETLMVDQFQILEAGSGETAWHQVQRELPDLVLLDIIMPGSLNGFDVCDLIKKNIRTKQVPVIYLTALPEQKTMGHHEHAEDIFYKPFSPIQLVDRIYDILGKN